MFDFHFLPQVSLRALFPDLPHPFSIDPLALALFVQGTFLTTEPSNVEHRFSNVLHFGSRFVFPAPSFVYSTQRGLLRRSGFVSLVLIRADPEQ
jgi:hypothetical protein